jgi:carboxyl-terminal processing protease
MKTKFVLLSVALGIFVGLFSCRNTRNENTKIFEKVWKKVNKTFFDPKFCGLDWKEVHNRYLPQVTATKNDEEFYRLVNKMLWELNVSHANLIPPGLLAQKEPLVCAAGSPGIDIRLLDGKAVITSVKPGSPAEEGGLRPGYLIQAVDEIPVSQIVQEAEMMMRPPDNDRNRIAIDTKAILGRVYGTPGTQVTIAYSDEEGEHYVKKMIRTIRKGRAVGPNGILYLAVDFEAKRLDYGIGYIRLNTFQPPLASLIAEAIHSIGDIHGLVFDLRGNSGGEIEEMPDLFLTKKTLLYLSRSRNGEDQVFFEPANNAYQGPLVLLIDPLSGSACELFAGCLQAIGRAVVIGERSPGAVVESDMKVFPDGTILMYPVAQLATPAGIVLEGRGVIPDIEIGLDREQLLKGIDTQIESAISFLEKTR